MLKKVIFIFGFVALAGVTFSITILSQKGLDNSDSIKMSQEKLSANDILNIKNITKESSHITKFDNDILNLSKSSAQILTRDNALDIILSFQ